MVPALAARKALSFAQETSIFQAEVEGDSLKVVSAINDSKPNRTLFGHIIEDIRIAKVCMQFCNFQHVRGGNKLAHSLAKRAILATYTDMWLEELLLDLEDVFQ